VKTSNDRLHKTDQKSSRSVGGRNEPAVPKLLLLTMIMIAALKMIISTKNRLFSFVKTVTKCHFAYSICYMQSKWSFYVA